MNYYLSIRKSLQISCLCLILFTVTFIRAEDPIKLIKRASNGHGILANSRGNMIMIVSGTPEQMGTAHGELLKAGIHFMLDKICLIAGAYAIGKNDWFFTRMEEVRRRTGPFTPKRFIEECDAMSKTAGISEINGRNLNFFPEMFHCSGFAVRNKASKDGTILHARVLDYMRDVHLQRSAVVMVFIPDKYNAWLSISYSGFIGTVTAMNEKGVAVGEMGGRGEGNWDGMPMSFLLRDIMERANNVKEALEIFEKTPRTCEYYYVVSDKYKDMAAVIAKGKEFKILKPGEQHPKLPEVPQDTVMLSAGSRSKALSKRLHKYYGKIDVKTMINIIKRPVAMKSNLHNAIFAPQTLDVWFSNAGKTSIACNCPYFHLNLKELISFYKQNINPPSVKSKL